MVDQADVVILHPWRDAEDDEAPIHRDERSRCQHKYVRLNTSAHRLYCRDCDEEVDPFAFLLRLHGEWHYWVQHREAAEKRARAAQARLEETLRLERNARSRVKKLGSQDQLPVVPWGEARA